MSALRANNFVIDMIYSKFICSRRASRQPRVQLRSSRDDKAKQVVWQPFFLSSLAWCGGYRFRVIETLQVAAQQAAVASTVQAIKFILAKHLLKLRLFVCRSPRLDALHRDPCVDRMQHANNEIAMR
jgi:hypothetical protein